MDAKTTIPARLDGWQGLADLLGTFGIQRTAAALCERGRRKGLPFRGGGVPGNQVRFEKPDIEDWIRDLTGVDPDLWVEQRRRNTQRQARTPPRQDSPTGPKPRPWKALRAQREHIVLLRRAPHGEEALRGRRGKVWVATCEKKADGWPQAAVEAAGAVVRFRRVRAAIEADFDVKSTASPRASCLLVAFRMVESRLTLVPVPGDLFGLKAGTYPPAIASPAHPGLRELRDAVRREAPAAAWYVWEDRQDLDPVTLEAARRDEVDS